MVLKHAYAIRSLTHRYERDTVLDIPFLEIPQGQISALTGPNGSGKSTLLSILALITAPSGGSVFFSGAPVPADPELSIRRMVTLVHQKPVLFSASVRNNLSYGLKARGLKGKEIDDRIRAIAQDMKLSALLDKHARKLSGGETQRVVLARALILRTPVILLDEPTNSLDDAHRPILEWMLQKMNREAGTTIIIATHDSSFTSSLADRIYRMEKGRIPDIGT